MHSVPAHCGISGTASLLLTVKCRPVIPGYINVIDSIFITCMNSNSSNLWKTGLPKLNSVWIIWPVALTLHYIRHQNFILQQRSLYMFYNACCYVTRPVPFTLSFVWYDWIPKYVGTQKYWLDYKGIWLQQGFLLLISYLVQRMHHD